MSATLTPTMTTTAGPEIRPGRALLRVLLTSGVTAGALAVIGYWPTQNLGGSAGLTGMWAGIVLALVGAWAGSLPVVLALPKSPKHHLVAILVGLVIRFVVTAGLALAASLADIFPQTALLLWAGIAQFVLLGVDVLGLVGLLKQATKEAV